LLTPRLSRKKNDVPNESGLLKKQPVPELTASGEIDLSKIHQIGTFVRMLAIEYKAAGITRLKGQIHEQEITVKWFPRSAKNYVAMDFHYLPVARPLA
jgi:SET domain-containing protein